MDFLVPLGSSCQVIPSVSFIRHMLRAGVQLPGHPPQSLSLDTCREHQHGRQHLPVVRTRTGTEPVEATPVVPPAEEIEFQHLHVSSSSSPAEVEAVSNSSPPNHYRAHQGMLERVVMVLDIQEAHEKSHNLVDILASTELTRVALSINEAVTEPVEVLWHTPSFLTPQ